MPRRREVPKRPILPDPKYKSELLSRFINVLMKHGKKAVAERITYGALAIMTGKLAKVATKQQKGSAQEEGGSEGGARQIGAMDLFEQVLDNVKPAVEVRSRRVGGATYQVPVEIRADRSRALAMRWLVQSARQRGEKGMMERLAAEFVDAYENRGSAVKKREDTHRMAKANQAFAHFRWN